MQHRLDIENVYSRCVTLHFHNEGYATFIDTGTSLYIQLPGGGERVCSPVGAAVIKRLKRDNIPVHVR